MRFFESPNPSPALSDVAGNDLASTLEVDPVDRLLEEEGKTVEDVDTHLNEVLPGLWIGDIQAATDGETLKLHGITRVVSVLRGSVPTTEGIDSQTIPVDDIPSADLLAHLPAAVDYIRQALSDDVEGGVLVHCQAGMSRSATVVAAYLMSEHELSVEDALTTIRRARRCIQPSDAFLAQLEIFGAAKYRVSHKDRATRDFYRDRVVTEVLNGDGSAITSTHFAQYPGPSRPSSMSGSGPSSPSSTNAYRRRKLRCGSCRRELALREHVLHAQQTPAGTPPLAFTSIFQPPSGSTPHTRSPSVGGTTPVHSSPLALTAIEIEDRVPSSSSTQPPPPIVTAPPFLGVVPNGPPETHPAPRTIPPAIARARTKSLLAALSASLLSVTTVSDNSPFDDDDEEEEQPSPLRTTPSTGLPPPSSDPPLDSHTDSPLHRRLSLSRLSLKPSTPLLPPTPTPTATATPTPPSGPSSRRPSFTALTPLPPPILTNPKCSGYFLEPMSWMDSSISTGQLAGKILCPNERCKAKIGSFDWAGSKCGCKEWITPGFCLHRSKVDDIAF
ncbi:hypothetical protein BDY24DRAFT_368944 [Mrakia frigida]|uniref:dual specificity protein phosphatase family protein n=1 Tax=Mrakia frigida TaxID=29902 RepID=UPI003FCBF7B0